MDVGKADCGLGKAQVWIGKEDMDWVKLEYGLGKARVLYWVK